MTFLSRRSGKHGSLIFNLFVFKSIDRIFILRHCFGFRIKLLKFAIQLIYFLLIIELGIFELFLLILPLFNLFN